MKRLCAVLQCECVCHTRCVFHKFVCVQLPNSVLESISMIDTLGNLGCAEETKGVDIAEQQDTDVAPPGGTHSLSLPLYPFLTPAEL